MINVFLAYSSFDRNILLTILDDLKLSQERYYLWYYLPGKNDVPMEKIHEVIADMDIFLLLLSENSLHSPNVQKELGLAFEEKQIKEICPITVDNCLKEDTDIKIPEFIKENIYYSNPMISAARIIEGILYKY